MNDAFFDYENRVERGETVTIAGRTARWTKIKNLEVGAKIAIPKEEIMSRFASNRHSGNPPAGGASRIDSGVAFAPQNDGCDSVSWDEIVEIKSLGREHVYDIEVEGTHNFIGNGIFAHNTYISGNLGVGSSSPVNKFEVSGNAVIGSGYAQAAVAPADGLLVQGNVGIGTTNPGATLEVNGTLKVDSLTTGGSALYINGGILSSSDESLKNNVTGFDPVLAKLNALTPVDFNWKKSGMADTGFIAQDVGQVLPGSLIELAPNGADAALVAPGEKIKSYGLGPAFNALVVESIKELNNKIDSGVVAGLLPRMTGVESITNVGIGSTSPIANRFAGIDAKLSENGQILGQQGEKLNTVDAAIQALLARVTELENRGQINGVTVPEKETPSSGSEGVSFNSGLQSVLVTASGTIPADLSYGIGIENGEQINGGTESSASAVLGEATESAHLEGGTEATPSAEASSSSVPEKETPSSGSEGVSFNSGTESSASAEATPSASGVQQIENGVQINGATESSASAEASPSALRSSVPLSSDLQSTPAALAPEKETPSSGSEGVSFNSDVNLATFGNLTITAGLRVFGQTLLGPTNIAGITTVGNIVIDEDSLDAFGILRIQTLARGLIELMAGQITIDTAGNIILHSGNLVVETGQIYGNDSMRGSVTLTTNATYAVVPQSWSKAPKSIVVTPDYNTRAWVENLGANGFIVRVDPAPTNSQKVYWIAVW